MSSSLSFTYGNYQFEPRPLFSINAAPLKTTDGVGYGTNYTIELNGQLITTGDQLSSGIVGVFDKVELLKSALDHDGKLLIVSCNNDPILSGYPLIENFDFNNASDNYTRRADYNITFVMPTTVGGTGADNFNDSSHPPFIESCEETWDVEFQDERKGMTWDIGTGTETHGYVATVTHTVNVQARNAYTGSEISNIPWEDAKDYAITRLGMDYDFVTLTGILNLPASGFNGINAYNHYRRVSTNKSNGSIQVTETFIVTPSGTDLPSNAIETFDLSIAQNQGITTININGEIKGLDSSPTFNMGADATTNKYLAASGYFNVVKDRFFDRASTAYSAVSGDCFNRSLNPTVRSRTVGINPINGTISYNYQYDTIPQGCIAGDCIISQNITIDDTLQSDVFASQVVLGRALGPILQDIGTKTVRVRSVNVEIVTLPPTSCSTIEEMYSPAPTGQVDDFISVISGDLISNYSQVFISNNVQNWNFTNGRYTRSVSFTYNNCTDGI